MACCHRDSESRAQGLMQRRVHQIFRFESWHKAERKPSMNNGNRLAIDTAAAVEREQF